MAARDGVLRVGEDSERNEWMERDGRRQRVQGRTKGQRSEESGDKEGDEGGAGDGLGKSFIHSLIHGFPGGQTVAGMGQGAGCQGQDRGLLPVAARGWDGGRRRPGDSVRAPQPSPAPSPGAQPLRTASSCRRRHPRRPTALGLSLRSSPRLFAPVFVCLFLYL